MKVPKFLISNKQFSKESVTSYLLLLANLLATLAIQSYLEVTHLEIRRISRLTSAHVTTITGTPTYSKTRPETHQP